MLYEDLRYIHEDIERLEAACADRLQETPKHLRNRLLRDHELSQLLSRIHSQSERALHIYRDAQQALTEEVQAISTGDSLESFYAKLEEVKDFHQRYPNEPVENLERLYKLRDREDGGGMGIDVDGMFTGEEAFGRFFDLTMLHEEYLNLPGIRTNRKLNYMQYLDIFDIFTPPHCTISRHDKMTEQYFSYVTSLAHYLESFIRRTKPLEDLDRLFGAFDAEFEKSWDEDSVLGWEKHAAQLNTTNKSRPVTQGTGEGVWCPDCEKEFNNDNVYKAHLTGKKHLKNAELRKENSSSSTADVEMTNGTSTSTTSTSTQRLKEKAIAEREHRITKLTNAMKTEREDTRVNVERKAGMTDKERQQELAALYAEDAAANATSRRKDDNEDSDSEGEEKIYNPLKLPLAWDGKPIPFWLYKLHGLGVEFPCEICGNYVYMGRRAFDKHFSEARHIYGLKCLGITNTSLFREITGIDEALKLWEKVQRDRGTERGKGEGVVEMEDSEGNVMPQRVYEDLKKQGLL